MNIVIKKSYMFMGYTEDDCFYDLHSVDGVEIYSEYNCNKELIEKFEETLNGSKTSLIDCMSALYYDLLLWDVDFPYEVWIQLEDSENISFEKWLNKKGIFIEVIE